MSEPDLPPPHTPEHHPRRRLSDHGVRGWISIVWHNLVPLIAIGLAALAVGQNRGDAARARALSAQNADLLQRQVAGRRIAIRESCEQDEALSDLMRRILAQFGVLDDPHIRRQLRPLFRPLGGIRPLTQAQRDARCDARVARGIKRGG